MFYEQRLLCKKSGGKFSVIWSAATTGIKGIPRSTISSLKILTICEEILKVIQSESSDYRKRFSLYLSTQLVYGLVLSYNKQVCLFVAELVHFMTQIRRPLIYAIERRPHDDDDLDDVGPAKKKRKPRQKKAVDPQVELDRIAAEAELSMRQLATQPPLIATDENLITLRDNLQAQTSNINREYDPFGDEGQVQMQIASMTDEAWALDMPAKEPATSVLEEMNVYPTGKRVSVAPIDVEATVIQRGALSPDTPPLERIRRKAADKRTDLDSNGNHIPQQADIAPVEMETAIPAAPASFAPSVVVPRPEPVQETAQGANGEEQLMPPPAKKPRAIFRKKPSTNFVGPVSREPTSHRGVSIAFDSRVNRFLSPNQSPRLQQQENVLDDLLNALMRTNYAPEDIHQISVLVTEGCDVSALRARRSAIEGQSLIQDFSIENTALELPPQVDDASLIVQPENIHRDISAAEDVTAIEFKPEFQKEVLEAEISEIQPEIVNRPTTPEKRGQPRIHTSTPVRFKTEEQRTRNTLDSLRRMFEINNQQECDITDICSQLTRRNISVIFLDLLYLYSKNYILLTTIPGTCEFDKILPGPKMLNFQF